VARAGIWTQQLAAVFAVTAQLAMADALMAQPGARAPVRTAWLIARGT